MRCFVHFDLQMCFSPQRRAIFRHLNRQKWSRIVSFLAFSLPNVLFATVACNFSTSERPKVVQTCGVLYILTWKCASRHNGVHFFDISTSKRAPNPLFFYTFDFGIFRNVLRATTVCIFSTSQFPKVVQAWCVLMCFGHFDLEMCFAPQRRALFQHLNFQKCSEPGVFLTHQTSKCASRHNGVHFFNISTSKSAPNLVCLTHQTSKCASRHNGVHFFDISPSKSAPQLPCF